MRIISGKYRRRKLLANPGLTTRPVTDRIKVTLFDRLSVRLVDACVADIFAGTGSFGLESLSRGSRLAVFFEQDRRARDLLAENIESIGIEEPTLCWRTDAFRSSYKPKGVPGWAPYDIVFFDPPYKFMEKAGTDSKPFSALSRLAHDDVTAAGALLVVRTSGTAKFEVPPEWTLQECMKRSSMAVYLFEKTNPDSAGDANE
jgi:16S rRNA (guanine966-N2)-methyltransferase